MSRRNSYPVTSNSIKNPRLKEEIFMQAIDQQYEKLKETRDIEDGAEFFIEYDQKQNMNKIISMMTDLEFSTDSESPPNFLTINSLKEQNEKNSKSRPRKPSFTQVFLVEKWKRNAEDLIQDQKNKIISSCFSQIRTQFLGIPFRANDPDIRPRASSNKLKPIFETDSELKLSDSLFNQNSKNSINAVGRSNSKTPYV